MAGGTLSSGASGLADCGVVSSLVVVGLSGGWPRLVSVVERVFRASDSLSVNGISGEFDDGVFGALMISRAAAMMMSAVDAVGMGMVVGNHVTVSQMRSARVSQIHTL